MAIRFVDVEPEGDPKPKRSEKADAPLSKREPDGEAPAERPGASPLPYAKSEPKPRGRKKPLK